jgi:hypothetical protein
VVRLVDLLVVDNHLRELPHHQQRLLCRDTLVEPVELRLMKAAAVVVQVLPEALGLVALAALVGRASGLTLLLKTEPKPKEAALVLGPVCLAVLLQAARVAVVKAAMQAQATVWQIQAAGLEVAQGAVRGLVGQVLLF